MRKKVFEITILDDIICIKTDDFYFAFNEECTGMQGMTGNQEEALGSKYRELGLLARLIAKNEYSTFPELRSLTVLTQLKKNMKKARK